MIIPVQERLYQDIPIIEDEKFQEQVIVDEEDNVLGFNKKMLIASTSLSVEEMVFLIHSLQGIAIASHIERTFGIIAQLGFIPKGLELDGIEGLGGIATSDAHFLQDIGNRYTIFDMKKRIYSQNWRKNEFQNLVITSFLEKVYLKFPKIMSSYLRK